MRKLLFSFILLFVLTGLVHSQIFQLKGTINEKPGTPAIGAPVLLLKPDSTLVKGSVTDLEGNFTILNVPQGNYILKVTYLGFADHFRNINVTESISFGSIVLKTSAKTLKEVEVV